MKKHYLNYILLFMVGLLLLLFTKEATSFFGSTTDWWNQHVTLASYFRDMFYETGDFFSSFAPHLGGGMNLFSLSYYGLYSPWLLLSYLLPHVSMLTYVQIIQMVCYFATIFLTYRFFVHKKYENKIALLASLMMACATPVLYHFHRQIMFVNYLPFLLLAFFGIDRYFTKQKKDLLIISTFLMIMTSFYYSISGMLALTVYAYYQFYKEHQSIKQSFKKVLLPLGISFFISVCLAGLLLVPTFSALLGGRTESIQGSALLLQFLPNISFVNLLYHNYNLGLTAVSLLALITGVFSPKKELKFLAVTLGVVLLFPIISLLLNGGLYARGKILLPFLPLVLLVVAEFYTRKKESVPWPKVIVTTMLFLLVAFVFEFRNKSYWYLCLLDSLLLLGGMIYAWKKKKDTILYIGPLLIMVSLAFFVNRFDEDYVRLNDIHNYQNKETEALITKTLKEDQGFYRFHNLVDVTNTMNYIYGPNYYQTSIYSSLENKEYQSFYRTFLQSFSEENYLMLANTMNPFFLTYMNVKYIVGPSAPIGYTLLEEKSSVSLYQNENTYPLAYATSKLLSESLFQKQNAVDKMLSLLQNAVVESSSQEGTPYHQESESFEYMVLQNDLAVIQEEGKLRFESETEKRASLKLAEPIQGDILLLAFDVAPSTTCTDESRSITINGIKNTQSCEKWTYANQNHTFYYALSQNEAWDTLEIMVSEGTYEISNIKTYRISSNILNSYQETLSPFLVDTTKTTQDYLVGDIDNQTDGYFVTSIPYDEGFTVLVNKEEVPYEKVNTAFIGFPLKQGTYHIEITYQAPGQRLGISLSILGTLFLIGNTLYDRKKSRSVQ